MQKQQKRSTPTQKHIKAKLALSDESRIGTTSSDPYLGSPTFDEVPFHINIGHQPALGTYVVIERDTDRIVHYGRIIDGTEDNPRAKPSALQQNQAYQVGARDPRPGDMAPHVTRVMTVEVLGEIHLDDSDNLGVKEPSQLAQTGKAVHELPIHLIPWLQNIPDSSDKGLYIGLIESGNGSVDFILPIDATARHLAVVGKTGVGKSYFAGVLIEELVRHEIPIIAFDVLGDMINATEDLNGQNLKAGYNFKVPYSVIGLTEFLGFVPNLTSDQSEIVSFAYDVVSSRAFKSLEETGRVNISIDTLTEEITKVAADFGQDAVGKRASKKVETAFRRNSLLTTKTENWLNELGELPTPP